MTEHVEPEPNDGVVAREEVYFESSLIELGYVRLNAEVDGTAEIVNGTQATVRFGTPKKSCTCTAVELGSNELPPGERTKVAFRIRTGNVRGTRTEVVAVPVFDVNSPGTEAEIYLRLFFKPKGVFEVEPGSITLTTAEPRATFTVRGDDAAARNRVLAVRCPDEGIRVDGSRLPVVEIEWLTVGRSVRNADTECLIYTDNPNEDMIRVPIRMRKDQP